MRWASSALSYTSDLILTGIFPFPLTFISGPLLAQYLASDHLPSPLGPLALWEDLFDRIQRTQSPRDGRRDRRAVDSEAG